MSVLLFLLFFFFVFLLLGPRTNAIVGNETSSSFKWFNYVGTTENITMRSMSQTVRLLENVGFTVDNPRSPSYVMALSNIYSDIRVSVFSQASGPRTQA